MTVTELIANVLGQIRGAFYADRVREFQRDQRALIKAISRYGYECAQRGWSFQVEFIAAEFRRLLTEIKTSGADIHYLPTYLEGAVRRHIGQRAEELSAKAKATAPKALKIADGVKPVVVVEASAEELLSVLHKDLARTLKGRRKEGVEGRKTAKLQGELL